MRSKSTVLMEKIIDFAQRYFVENGKSPTKAEIAEGTGITAGTVSKYLSYMRNNSMIEYDGYTIHTPLTKKYDGTGCSAAILGSVSCGPLQFENEDIESFVSLPEVIFGKGEFYILKANGDSMKDAGIDDGDWVIIKRQSAAKEGDIIVALVDGMNNLKYYFFDKDRNCPCLKSANEKYEDIFVQNLVIQGVATKIIKNI